MFVSRPVILVRSPGSRGALRDGGIHLLNRYRLPSPAAKQAFQFLYGASGGNDVEFSFPNFDEFNPISGVNSQLSADLYRYGDLPLGSNLRGGHRKLLSIPPIPYIIVRNGMKVNVVALTHPP